MDRASYIFGLKTDSFSSPFCRRSGDTVHNRFLEHAGGDRIRHALLAKRARWVQHANVNTPRCNVTVWNCHFYSFDTLVTLGQGGMTPSISWTRVLSVVEALLGFSLLTASISWIVLIYPALGRMRTMSRFASSLVRAEESTRVEILSGDAEQLLGSMAQDVIRTRIDFVHFPMIYYFYAATERASLPQALGQLLEVAERAGEESQPERVRLTAATLRAALEDFAEILAARFVEGDAKNPENVFTAFQRDHLIDSAQTASGHGSAVNQRQRRS